MISLLLWKHPLQVLDALHLSHPGSSAVKSKYLFLHEATVFFRVHKESLWLHSSTCQQDCLRLIQLIDEGNEPPGLAPQIRIHLRDVIHQDDVKVPCQGLQRTNP